MPALDQLHDMTSPRLKPPGMNQHAGSAHVRVADAERTAHARYFRLHRGARLRAFIDLGPRRRIRRATDSLAVRSFLRRSAIEDAPRDHSTISASRGGLGPARRCTHRDTDLRVGSTTTRRGGIAQVDTPCRRPMRPVLCGASPSRCAVLRLDTAASRQAFLTDRRRVALGIETPTREDVARADNGARSPDVDHARLCGPDASRPSLRRSSKTFASTVVTGLAHKAVHAVDVWTSCASLSPVPGPRASGSRSPRRRGDDRQKRLTALAESRRTMLRIAAFASRRHRHRSPRSST